jgi:hypothetical protein
MPKPPRSHSRAELLGLSDGSKRLFAEICDAYGIVDSGGRQTLRSGLKSLQQAEEAERIVETEGRMVTDRFGQRRAHPMLVIARDFRAQWLQALRQLNLAIGEPPQVGRPGLKL